MIDECLHALSDPARRRAIETLAGGARRAGELALAAGVPPAAMSRHLKVLLGAGIVDDERSVTDARVRLFFLRREVLAQVGAWLDDLVIPRPASPAPPGFKP
ncbi:MAG: ArsR/SmtB family transcription factor [Acidimicrobiales bacterium]